LLAELEASLGTGRVGVLCWADSHRPEAQSVLRSVVLDDAGRPPSLVVAPQHEGELEWPWWWSSTPTRLLSQPWPLGSISAGALVTIAHERYLVDRIRFELRLDRVQWWTPTPLSRDYARAWLYGARGGAQEHVEAWIYVEPGRSRCFLHGWFD
jgi:protein ImuB